MKRVYVLVCALAILGANAQPAETDGSLESRVGAGLAKASTDLSNRAKPNEIVKGKITYSGIAVQMLITAHPLQLVNPAAPVRYGSSEDNVLRDLFSGKAAGLKIFSIRF
jgi:hypothetical protein